MPKNLTWKQYQEREDVLEGQLDHLRRTAPNFDPKLEAARKRELTRSLDGVIRELRKRLGAAELARDLVVRGVQLPDLAEAIGLPPVTPRAPPKRMPWRIRPGTDAAIVADMLLDAGTRGLTESEIVSSLQRRGRLAGARDPRRAAHWTITNLQKRTKALVRNESTRRWRVIGALAIFKSDAAH